MDISNLTITPDLFYPKNTSDTWKPRCLSKVPSTQIPKKKLEAVNTKNVKKRFKKLMSNGPMLGRIGKIRNMGLKKNMLKKKAVVLKEMSGNVIGLKKNNNNVKAPTKQEEIKLLKHMKIMEKEAQERLFVDMNLNIKRKRSKGSSFKFFKSKNCQAEDEKESSLIDDDLVPEIQNYSPTSSAETSWKVQEKPRLIIDPEDFEDDCEPVIDGNVIESLLETLNDTNTSFKTSKMSQKTSVFSLDSLIETLEATGDKEAKKKPKVKFLGFGNNQLQIDAGQKNFGFAECKDCGFSYNINVPEDEKMHNKHHQSFMTIPRFRGWTTEDAIAITEWSDQNGRIIHLSPDHKNIKSENVKELICKMEMEFGVQEDYEKFHIYLAAYDSKLVGIATVRDSVTATINNVEKLVSVGIQRLFVRPTFRHKGVATALLKTIVVMHKKGDLIDIQTDVAFSSPTDEGKKLVTKVVGSDNFYVF